MGDLQQKLEALKGLVGVLNSMDDVETQYAARPPNNPHPAPAPAPVSARSHRSSGKYNNTGNQKIKGPSNQTGIASGISVLAVGSCDARRRQTQAQPSNPNTNTTTCEEELAYLNNGKQNIKGLTNGVINFGSLSASAAPQRQIGAIQAGSCEAHFSAVEGAMLNASPHGTRLDNTAGMPSEVSGAKKHCLHGLKNSAVAGAITGATLALTSENSSHEQIVQCAITGAAISTVKIGC
ncbi:hypothetical protein RJT34_32176 [Clitoria ternatea]|uniref:Uncharacterized protein n=1 Tax=Clitoria ternatea TaxID=43366 RepID=A0AAN9EVX6_CLITE